MAAHCSMVNTSCRSSAGRCLIFIHPIVRISRPVISVSCYTSRNSSPVSVRVFRMTERRRWVSHSGSNPRRQNFITEDTKVGPTVWQISQCRRWICWKIAQHILYLLQWIFPDKLVFTHYILKYTFYWPLHLHSLCLSFKGRDNEFWNTLYMINVNGKSQENKSLIGIYVGSEKRECMPP